MHPWHWHWQAALKIRDEEEGSTARSSSAVVVVADETKAKPAMVPRVQDTSAAQVYLLPHNSHPGVPWKGTGRLQLTRC